MANGEDQAPPQTLMQHLSSQEIGQIAQKKLLGGYDVPMGAFFLTGGWLFQKGAILGRARHDSLITLAGLLASKPEEIPAVLKVVADDLLGNAGSETESITNFFFKAMLPNIDIYDLDTLRKLDKEKRRLGELIPKIEEYVISGIAVGAIYPDLTEKMLRAFYAKRDDKTWTLARKAGVDLPEQDTELSLEDVEQQVLLEVAEYATAYFPQLVEPLGLRVG